MVFFWWWKRETCSTMRHMYHTYICDRFRHLKSTRFTFSLGLYILRNVPLFTLIINFPCKLFLFFFFSLEYGLPWSLHFEEWSSNLTRYWCTRSSSSYGNFMEKFPIIFQIVACMNLVIMDEEAIAQWACCLLGTQISWTNYRCSPPFLHSKIFNYWNKKLSKRDCK